MAQLEIIYWRDIPAQIVARKSRREQVKHVLSERFEQAIDMAAMRGKLAETDDYLAQWRKGPSKEVSDDLQAEVEAEAARVEADYSPERLKSLVKAGGISGDNP